MKKNDNLMERPGPAAGHFTIEPVRAGDTSNDLAEFGDHRAVFHTFGVKRGTLYTITNLGLVKSVSLRRPGQKFSKRLWHLQSIRDYLHSLMQSQELPPTSQQPISTDADGAGAVDSPNNGTVKGKSK
jgi:hypothetical protein